MCTNCPAGCCISFWFITLPALPSPTNAGDKNALCRGEATTMVPHEGAVLNTLRPRQNGRHFADILKCIFLNENVWIPIKTSLKFVPKGPINNIPTLVQIMAWRRSGDKPLSESMLVSLQTHICVTRPQWVNLHAAIWAPAAIPQPASADLSNAESQLALQQKMLDVLTLPQTPLMTFNGDPVKFWIFIKAFDLCVGNYDIDEGLKLNRLFQYCSGKAAKVIQPCVLMNPWESYDRTQALLFKRFGNDYIISKAWIRKVLWGAPIGPNVEALQDFLDDLSGCMGTLRATGRLNEIDTRSKMDWIGFV